MNIFNDDVEKAAFFSGLKELGVVKLVAEYSGSGDSGDLDGVYGQDSTDDNIALGDFADKARDLMYEILTSNYSYDWYNNNGGYGTVYFDITDMSYNVEGYVRIESDAYESGELDINDIN